MSNTAYSLDAIVFPLLNWFRDNARVLPWRSDPTPYHVWVSEIMLQQTRVAAVLDYYARFMETFPTLSALAEGDEDVLMKQWQGLGYYSRARNLQKAARQVMDEYGGAFPSSYSAILTLPGIGEYTAGAIASIAFHEPVPAVDGNVLRVITRVTGDPSPIDRPDTKRAVREALCQIIPTRFPGHFNQALMELGALVCLPNGAPLCDRCPLREQCAAHHQGTTGQIPAKSPKKPRRTEHRRVWLIFSPEGVALRRRPERGLLAGLWEYPNRLDTDTPADWESQLPPAALCAVGKHIFTHIEWHLEGYSVYAPEFVLPEGWVWAKGWELRQIYALPNAFSCLRDPVFSALSGAGHQ